MTGRRTLSGIPVGASEPVTLTIEAERIAAIEPGGDRHLVLAPGLVDIHCHGGGGAEFGIGDPEQAASFHHRAGSTTVIASLVSAALSELAVRVEALRRPVEGGLLAGIHLEGPFLSHARCGAQNPNALVSPDPDATRHLLSVGGGGVKMMTIAPELPGALDVIAVLTDAGVVPAFGHTDATEQPIRDALDVVERGAASAVFTHLFNAMPPVHHRSPGPAMIGLAAAAAGKSFVELIGDGVHLADETLIAAISAARTHAVLISDSTAATGLGDGTFQLGALSVQVVGRTSRLVDGDSIAGSVSTLWDIVQGALAAGIDPVTVFAAATVQPARALGLDAGYLRVGGPADALVMSTDFELIEVWRRGRQLAAPMTDQNPPTE